MRQVLPANGAAIKQNKAGGNGPKFAGFAKFTCAPRSTGKNDPVREISVCCLVQRLQFSEEDLIAALRALDSAPCHKIPDGELSIALLDDGTMVAMHGKFLGDTAPTDVITFDGDGAENFAGEICVSVEYAAQSAVDRGIAIADELMLYIVHGWLHLAGLRDGTAEEAAEMRCGESRLIEFLRGRNLFVSFSLAEDHMDRIENLRWDVATQSPPN
jgi:probable rRNA maturation factor